MATAIAPAPIGHNNPPMTPYETMKAHIDDLFDEAVGFLDGEPILTQELADAVDALKAKALEAEKAGEALRKDEAKPFDDGKKEVQERWNPLVNDKTGRCRLIIQTCAKALTPFLVAKQAAINAEAARVRKIADDELAAAQAARATASDNLAARQQAEDALAFAAQTYKAANKMAGTRAQAKGGARATSLRSVWTATITDRRAALNHLIKEYAEDFAELVDRLAQMEAKRLKADFPGATVTEERIAQ